MRTGPGRWQREGPTWRVPGPLSCPAETGAGFSRDAPTSPLGQPTTLDRAGGGRGEAQATLQQVQGHSHTSELKQSVSSSSPFTSHTRDPPSRTWDSLGSTVTRQRHGRKAPDLGRQGPELGRGPSWAPAVRRESGRDLPCIREVTPLRMMGSRGSCCGGPTLSPSGWTDLRACCSEISSPVVLSVGGSSLTSSP